MTHVLITRPLQASQQLAASLHEFGLSTIVMPLYTFAARSPGLDVEAVLQSASGRKLVVFTSTRAVQFGLAHLPAMSRATLEYAALGSATRRQLEAAGHSVQLQALNGFTSEDLLQLPTLAVEPGIAIIFAAPAGRDTLAKGLLALGWEVSLAMVYERKALSPSQEKLEAINDAGNLLSLWTSISALKLAEKNLPGMTWKKILASPMLVISARIEHHLQQLGASRISLSRGPGNADLLQSIRHLLEQHGQNPRERKN